TYPLEPPLQKGYCATPQAPARKFLGHFMIPYYNRAWRLRFHSLSVSKNFFVPMFQKNNTPKFFSFSISAGSVPSAVKIVSKSRLFL
ncbi:MAG: hypothetical protein NTW55_01650, partial [Planctomycetota bacterium]|nr:hypothetical protein [Planctomycetota bacterium]